MAASAPPDVPPPVRQLAVELADVKPMRHGSLCEPLVRKILRRVTVPTTASRMLLEARPAPASSLPNRPIWSASRSLPAVSFAAGWTLCGRHAKHGPMANWKVWPLPPRRLRKGAPSEPPKRNHSGNRSALRPAPLNRRRAHCPLDLLSLLGYQRLRFRKSLAGSCANALSPHGIGAPSRVS